MNPLNNKGTERNRRLQRKKGNVTVNLVIVDNFKKWEKQNVWTVLIKNKDSVFMTEAV